MITIALQDANILIDLYNIGLLEHCMQLNYQFCTTDIIFAELHEEQSDHLKPFVTNGRFTIIPIPEDILSAIKDLAKQNAKLSEQDCSAYYYATTQGAILLTGDQHLKKLAQANDVPTHDILWLLDEMIAGNCLSKIEACERLKLLMTKNKRIPVTECELRLKQWGE